VSEATRQEETSDKIIHNNIHNQEKNPNGESRIKTCLTVAKNIFKNYLILMIAFAQKIDIAEDNFSIEETAALSKELSALYRSLKIKKFGALDSNRETNLFTVDAFRASCSIIVDVDGNYPLHRAAAAEVTDMKLIANLINAYPKALLHTNKNGWMPLHVKYTSIICCILTYYFLCSLLSSEMTLIVKLLRYCSQLVQ